MDMIEFSNRVNSFNVEQELKQLVFNNEKLIVKMNRDALLKGENVKGEIIGVYSPFTENFTSKESGIGFPKKAFKPWNIYDSGSVQKGITIAYKDGIITFYSVSSNVGDLFDTIKKHGLVKDTNTIFGLSVKNSEILSFDILIPKLNSRLKKKIGN